MLLVGRPGCNKVTARFAAELPVSFGEGSFVVRDEAYAHPDSAVLAAAENPLNRRYSLVVAIAGLGAASTLRAAPLLMDASLEAAEGIVLAPDRPALVADGPGARFGPRRGDGEGGEVSK